MSAPFRGKLIVRYRRYNAEYSGWKLIAWPLTDPTCIVQAYQFGEIYNGAAVYSIDLNAFDSSILSTGIGLSPLFHDQRANSFDYAWVPSQSFDVFLLEGEHELVPRKYSEILLCYHRLSSIGNSQTTVPSGVSSAQFLASAEQVHQWHLRLWTFIPPKKKASAASHMDVATLALDNKSHEDKEKAASVASYVSGAAMPQNLTKDKEWTIKPQKIFPDGRLVYDTSIAHFPADRPIYVQPVRLARNLDGEEIELAKDCVKVWIDRHAGTHLHHTAQGETEVKLEEQIDLQSILDKRWITVRYFRHGMDPISYKSWDIWAWDAEDDKATSHAISWHETSIVDSILCAEFKVDRSLFCTGNRICLLPRKGGKSWSQRGHKTIEWSRGLPNPFSDKPFLLLEGYDHLVRDLSQAYGSMTCYVDGPNSVKISTSLPLEWFAPKGKPDFGIQFKAKSRDDVALDIVNAKLVDPWVFHVELKPGKFEFEEDFPVEHYIVMAPNTNSQVLEWPRYENTDKYYYDGQLGWIYKLGWIYTPESTTIRVFAPSADLVSVILYDEPVGDRGRKQIPMRRIMEGVWKAIIQGDLKGKYYKLLAEAADKRKYPGIEVIDPYSRCNTAHNGRGLIFGEEKTPVTDRNNIKPEHAIVYELHLRDATIDPSSGVNLRGKYLGLTERNTM